ncbi:DUF6531 domain-containing protein, partial [Planctomycetota bacterium]
MKEHERSERVTVTRGARSSITSALSRRVFPVLLLCVLLVQTIALANLPGFRAPLLDTPAPPSQFQSLLPSSPGSGYSTSDAEIEELARALKYDPGLMYKFVHDYIKFELYWGDLKGPYMTWMDRSGNGYDQASLMIALLKEAVVHCTEYTVTNPKYVVGEIKITDTEAFKWLGLVDDADEANAILARAGIYATVQADINGGIDYIQMEHVWVKVTIDGNPYEFDPSYKTHSKTIVLGSLQSKMGYDIPSEFMTRALQGYTPGTPWIKEVNKTNIHNDLEEYSDTLIEYIRDNLSDGGLADLIGGRTIEAAEDSDLPPILPPYEDDIEQRDDEFDIENTPEMYRTSLRIQHVDIDKPFWSSDIYGRRLTLKYDASRRAQLILDGTPEVTGTQQTDLGDPYDLTLTVDHPYGTTDFDGTVTIKVTAGGFYNIVNGWGNTNTKIIEAHRGALEQFIHSGELDTSEEVLGESFAILGLTWLAQTSKMRALADSKVCDGTTALINHHMIGVAGQNYVAEQYDTPYIDIPLGHLGAYNFYDSKGVFLAVTGHAAAYEHEVIRQLQACDSVSTINLIEQANDLASDNKIYYTDESNWDQTIRVIDDLVSYSSDDVAFIDEYVDEGFTVRLPEYGALNVDTWTGTGFQAVKTESDKVTASYIISNGGGGAGAGSDDIEPSDLFDRGDVFAGEREGTYHHDSTDITIGTGGMPFGLSFSRSYSSQDRLKDGPLGLGWTHNFDITAKVRSDSFQALGSDSVMDAAAHIVALTVVCDILTSDPDNMSRNVIAMLCESWLMDQMMDNLVTIKQGGGKMQFTKLTDASNPDGFYNPPTRAALKLVLNDGDFRLKNTKGIFYDFDSFDRIEEWSNAYDDEDELDSKVVFDYDGDRLDKVQCMLGDSKVPWKLTFYYDDNNRIDYIEDSADPSRKIYYTFDGNGNLIEYKNPENPEPKVTKYAYHASNDGLLTQVFSPVNYDDPFLTNVYDPLGRLMQQTDGENNTTDYYLAGYRAETLEPLQEYPIGTWKQYSVIQWADEFGRPIRTIDQLGRESTAEYDGRSRLIGRISSFGTSSKYTYNKDGQIIQADSLCKDSPSDHDISSSFDFNTNENGEGRWFVHQKEATDPKGCKVEYEYDYDGGYGSTVGNLMKITYPEVDAGIATVEFTYNDYGQVLTKTDPEEMVTTYAYYGPDAGSTLQKVTVDQGGLNLTTEYTYDSVGNVESVTDPRGYTTENQYKDSRLLEMVFPPSPFDEYYTEYTYYDDGKLQHVRQKTELEGIVYLQSINYYKTGQQRTVKGPYKAGDFKGINLTTYFYDALGRVKKVKDAEENETETFYYPDGKVWKVIDAEDNVVVTNEYDDDGMLVEVKDAKNNITKYEYNDFGGLKKTTYPDDYCTEAGYNAYRETQSITTRAGATIQMAYDDLGRVKMKETPDKTIKYEYDLTGRVLEVYEFYAPSQKANLIKYTYDSAGRVKKVESPGDKDVSYQYDAASNRTGLTYPDETYITYEYDQLNRLTKIKDQDNTVLAQYTYDKRSRRTRLDYDNDTYITYDYDAASRLTEIDNTTDTGHHKYEYTYDLVGNRRTMLAHGESHSYTYDDIYQLTDVEYPPNYGNGEFTFTEFAYDAAGNRSSVNNGEMTYETNNLNQYDQVGAVIYEYDDNGNTTYDGVAYYSYDSENRLIAATYAGGPLNPPSLANALDNTTQSFETGVTEKWVVSAQPVTPSSVNSNSSLS